MSQAAYPLQRDFRPAAPASRRWVVTPLCLSLLAHLVIVSAIESTDWVEVGELGREGGRIFTIEIGIINPQELERVAMVPDLPFEDTHAATAAKPLSPDMFPDYRDAGPGEIKMGRKPVPRYPEEELPLVSKKGLSERSQAFVRDGELDAVDPNKVQVTYIPSSRKVDRPVEAKVTPKLRESSDELLRSLPRRVPRFVAKRGTPALSLEPPPSKAVSSRPIAFRLGRRAEALFAEKGGPVSAKPLDLEVDIDVYAEPESKHRFFRMTISQRRDSRLPVIAKNILFVVDISASIRPDMLEGVRRAIANAATGLNKSDRFNLVRFSEHWYKSFDRFVPSVPENIARAAQSVRREPGQVSTDVYTALRNVIASLPSTGKEATRPTNIYLISDGNPTTGIQDIRHIVNDLSTVIRTNYSIFSVDPGAPKANAYLLDLLAYRNRGCFARAKGPEVADAAILQLLRQFKDPVLMNLRAQYANFEVDQVYPATLPNLYAGQPIVIYGRCLPDETIGVRIIGDSAEERRKFLYTRHLPEILTGDKSIARQWARGKIHYLSSLIASEGERQEYLDEIRRLSRRYKLAAPYE